jgi:hypothetical protein
LEAGGRCDADHQPLVGDQLGQRCTVPGGAIENLGKYDQAREVLAEFRSTAEHLLEVVDILICLQRGC